MRRILTSPHGLITTLSQIKAKTVTPPHSPVLEKKMNGISVCIDQAEKDREKMSTENGFTTKSIYSLEN